MQTLINGETIVQKTLKNKIENSNGLSIVKFGADYWQVHSKAIEVIFTKYLNEFFMYELISDGADCYWNKTKIDAIYNR